MSVRTAPAPCPAAPLWWRTLAGSLLAACLAGPAGAYTEESPHTRDAAASIQDTLARLLAAGCGTSPPQRTQVLRHARLDEVARLMSQDQPLDVALQRARYLATRATHFKLTGWRTSADLTPELLMAPCVELADHPRAEVGIHAEGSRAVIVAVVPWLAELDDPMAVQRRVLQLTNAARAKARQCGTRLFARAPALAEDTRLHAAAQQHAHDLLKGRYLQHVGADGRAPGQRLRDAGYRWRSVGENLAAGLPSPAEVVQAWLDNPSHCANLMNPGFRHMGLAYATEPDRRPAIYWVQVFGSPP